MADPKASAPTAGQEFRAGWPLILASMAGMSFAPITTYTMGLFVGPLEEEHGWSRTMIMSGLTINAALGVVFAPFFGALVDKFGARRIAIPGIVVFFVFFALLSTVTSTQLHWWALWLGIAIGALMLKPTVWSYAVISRFDKARGLALALALSGTAVTGTVAPFIAEYFIQTHGWRAGYIGLAVVYAAVVLPLVLLFFFSKSDLDRTRKVDVSARSAAPLAGLTVRQGLRSASFWKIALGTMLVMVPITGGLVHFVPALTNKGLDRIDAVAAASALGLAAVVGRLTAGVLLDRINAKLIGGVAFFLPALVCATLILFEGDPVMAILIAVLLGICTGAEIEVSSYLSSKHFGLRNYGTLFGAIAGIMAFVAGVSPVLGGLTFDIYESYDLALIVAGICAAISSVLLFSLPAYPRHFEPA